MAAKRKAQQPPIQSKAVTAKKKAVAFLKLEWLHDQILICFGWLHAKIRQKMAGIGRACFLAFGNLLVPEILRRI